MATFITFIIVLSILVFVHELGHFTAAKLFKVRVDEFSLGFPPRLLKYKKGETLYSINAIPIGGYVKIKGEAGEGKGDADSFISKPIWQRAIILGAGVMMNIITAAVFISIGYMIGLPTPVGDEPLFMERFARVKESQVQVIQILPDSPAATAEIEPGDIIAQINGTEFNDVPAVQAYINENKDKTLTISILRGDKTLTKELIPQPLPDSDKYGMGVGLMNTGMVSYPFYIAPIHGVYRTTVITKDIVVAFGGLIKDLVVERNSEVPIAGPIGIAVLTGRASQLGFVYLLQFTALLSINLAIINVLPIPALDGSKLLLLVVEKIRGRAVKQELENVAHTLGFAALMLLMIVVTYKDLVQYGGRALEALANMF